MQNKQNNDNNKQVSGANKLPGANGGTTRKVSHKKVAEKAKQKSRRNKQKLGFYYSFLTFVLLFCLVQVGFGAILNISKTISYKSKINTMEKVWEDAEHRNKDLKNDIKLFSKTATLEEIARNNLKMAGDDEVLIIINTNQQQEKTKKRKIKNNNKNKNKADGV